MELWIVKWNFRGLADIGETNPLTLNERDDFVEFLGRYPEIDIWVFKVKETVLKNRMEHN